MHDQRCSIATLHAKSFGGSTYVQPVTGSVRQRLDAALQGFIAMQSTSKCNTAVLDWNKSVRANPGPTRVIQTEQSLSGDKHKEEATFCPAADFQSSKST